MKSSDWFFPTAFSSWDELEWAAMARVMNSGRFTMGPETEAFEAEIAAYHGRKHAIAVNSGSSANLVAVSSIAHKLGEYQGLSSVPAIAWATTYGPLTQHGFDTFTVRDVDRTWSTGLRVPDKITDPVESWDDIAILCPILGSVGSAYDNLDLWLLKSEYRRPIIIEDACESFGARTPDGRLTGTFGQLSTGSGFYSHQLSAIELGWVLTDDDELARLCRLLRNHGNDGWGQDDFSKSYNFVLFGMNLRPVEMHCAIAREQLKKQDDFAKERRRNWRIFADLARGLPIRMQEMRGDPNPFGVSFTIDRAEERLPGADQANQGLRSLLVTALRAESIDCRLPTGGSFTRHPYGATWRGQPTPNADRVHDTGMFLGNAPYDISDKIERAIKVMRHTLSK